MKSVTVGYGVTLHGWGNPSLELLLTTREISKCLTLVTYQKRLNC